MSEEEQESEREDEPLQTEGDRPIKSGNSGFAITPGNDRMKYAAPVKCLGFSFDPVDPSMRSLSEERCNKLTFHTVAGPAVRSMRCALPLKFIAIALFPVVALVNSSCPEANMFYGHYPNWIWVFYVLGLFCSGWLEWKCLKIVMVPYVQWLAPFKILGFKVPLWLWLANQAITSSAAKLDIAFCSLFVVKVVKSFTCDETSWKFAQEAWKYGVMNSIFCWVPWLNQLLAICLLGWAIIVLQLIFASLMSYPSKGILETDYKVESEPKGYTTPWRDCTETFACFLSGLPNGSPMEWHSDILRIIAEAARARSIVELSCEWQIERVVRELDQLNQIYAADQEKLQKKREKQRRGFEMLLKETQRTSFRLWFINILEKAVFMEVQVTMYALSKATSSSHHGNNDPQSIVSLILSFVCLVHALFVACCQLCRLRSTQKTMVERYGAFLHRSKEQRLDHEEQDREEIDNDEFETCREECKTRLFCLPSVGTLPTHGGILSMARGSEWQITLRMRVGICVLFFILVHTLVKFLMAFKVCKYGLWNVPTSISGEDYGCVDLSSMANKFNNTS